MQSVGAAVPTEVPRARH